MFVRQTNIATNRSRRALIASVAALVLCGVLTLSARSVGAAAEERSLDLTHTHTGEKLSIVYFRNGDYVPDALAQVNHFLRDFRTDDVTEIDPKLLDLLYDLRSVTGSTADFQIISCYRSPNTNEMLRSKSKSVAKNSMHIKGQAIDIRLTGYSTKKLREAALKLGRGGVGYYPGSDFIHVDTGRVRRW